MKNYQDAKIRDFFRIYIVLNGTWIQSIHHSADGILTIDDIIGPFNVDWLHLFFPQLADRKMKRRI